MHYDMAADLSGRVDRETLGLRRIAEEAAGIKPSAGKWSKKEELGHLIDSAANNHVRFVQGSLLEEYRGDGYRQDQWVDRHGYGGMAWEDLVELWRRYNLLLARLVSRIPAGQMQTQCTVASDPPVTLEFLIDDYILHMQHHLDHILGREKITKYPR